MQELWGINFSEEGVKAVILAQEEARRLGHNFIGTEHILLGLHPACREVRNLFKDKATLQLLRVETEAIIGRGSGFVAIDIPRTPRTKEVLKIAEELARGGEVTPLHLLAGLLKEGGGVAIAVLRKLDVNLGVLQGNLAFQKIIPEEGALSSSKANDRVRVNIEYRPARKHLKIVPLYVKGRVGKAERRFIAQQIALLKDSNLEPYQKGEWLVLLGEALMSMS